MRKIILIISILVLMLLFTSCDTVDDPEKIIDIYCEPQYVNTTESWNVNSHNDYRVIELKKHYDKSHDTYTVTLIFSRMRGAKWVD